MHTPSELCSTPHHINLDLSFNQPSKRIGKGVPFSGNYSLTVPITMNKGLTLREIARLAKVSTATVSRAINRVPTVDPVLARRIRR